MSNEYERLQQFFSGYFNQDWNADGADGWVDVINAFVEASPRGIVLQLREDLAWWLSESGESQHLPNEFGCDYDPRHLGLDDRSWVEAILRHLSTLITDKPDAA